MENSFDSQKQKGKNPKQIEFGKVATDNMFMAEYSNGEWNNGSIIPFQNLSLSPFTLGLHYGQTVFEGLKAFRLQNGNISIFRPERHFTRFNQSLHRMCMPEVPEEMFMQALSALIKTDAAWIPNDPDCSLYIRPMMFASDSKLGVRISSNYIFLIVCTPAGMYYSDPLRLKLETHYSRAFEGGTGSAKCGGNYGGAFFPYELAKNEGFDQIIWTDAKTHEFVEESGTMNIVFITDNQLITPNLSNTILEGITRDSLLKLAPEYGLEVNERPVRYNEIFEWGKTGKRVEAFGIGTAALIAPIKEITDGHETCNCYVENDAKMFMLKKALNDIRTGIKPDVYNWNYMV